MTNFIASYYRYYPFYAKSCKFSALNAHVLPWCIRVIPSALTCSSSPQYLPSCVRVAGSQVVGAVPLATRALSLVRGATVNPSSLKCSPGQAPVNLPSCVQIDSVNFPDSELPSGVTIPTDTINTALTSTGSSVPVQQLTCTENTAFPSCATIPANQVTAGTFQAGVTISASQINGTFAANQLCNGSAASIPLPSCWTVPGSQLVGTVPANLITGTIENNVVLNGSVASTVNISSSQLTGMIDLQQLCPLDGSTVPLPSCWRVPSNQLSGPISAAQITGTLGSTQTVNFNGSVSSTVQIPANQITGVIGTGVNMTGEIQGTAACASALACLGVVTAPQPVCQGTKCAIACPAGKSVLYCPQFLSDTVGLLNCAYDASSSNSTQCVYGVNTGCNSATVNTIGVYATCIASYTIA